MTKEKTERNKKMFREWYMGFRAYALTAQEKDRVSYISLSKKYGLSYPTVRDIIQRELKRYLKRRNISV